MSLPNRTKSMNTWIEDHNHKHEFETVKMAYLLEYVSRSASFSSTMGIELTPTAWNTTGITIRVQFCNKRPNSFKWYWVSEIDIEVRLSNVSGIGEMQAKQLNEFHIFQLQFSVQWNRTNLEPTCLGQS
jgi:hypothetical protein